ncbi:hypothetical protein C8Q79DRAFT_35098 [Trametes meyenii]|nr:hypothetical protein C8Q79DRAFT_35098 [Trametes meyenii]
MYVGHLCTQFFLSSHCADNLRHCVSPVLDPVRRRALAHSRALRGYTRGSAALAHSGCVRARPSLRLLTIDGHYTTSTTSLSATATSAMAKVRCSHCGKDVSPSTEFRHLTAKAPATLQAAALANDRTWFQGPKAVKRRHVEDHLAEQGEREATPDGTIDRMDATIGFESGVVVPDDHEEPEANGTSPDLAEAAMRTAGYSAWWVDCGTEDGG